jgi:hypothetical protein
MKKLAGSKRPFGSMAGGRIMAFALLLVLAGQPGCKKSEAQPQLVEYKAMLNLAGPASDGPPVDQLVLDSTHETLVPINKKEGWPQTQAGPTPVGVQFIDAGKNFTELVNGQVWHFREVYVVSFRLL